MCFKPKLLNIVTYLHEIRNNSLRHPLFLVLFLVPMVAPGNVRVNVVNSTLAEVHWDPVPLKSVRGHLQGYRVGEGKHCVLYSVAGPWWEPLVMNIISGWNYVASLFMTWEFTGDFTHCFQPYLKNPARVD